MQIVIKQKLNRIHGKLNWLLKRNERIFQESFRRMFDFTIKQIRKDLRTKFAKDIASELTDWRFLQDQGEKILKPAVLSIMQSGGQQAYSILAIEGTFDVLNVKAVKKAEEICAELVREVNGQTKKGIRTYISTGIKEGKAMPKIARELRPLVGLTKNQTKSIMNYRTLLSDKEKFPKLTASDIDRKVQRYADKTHRRRADTISITETANAQSEGVLMGYDDVGLEEVEFSAYPGCCDICAALDGRKYKINEAEGIITVHPHCKCAWLPVVEGGTITKPLEKPPSELG